MSETKSLPLNWIQASLGEVVEIVSGYGFPEKYQGKVDGDIPFFKVADISNAVKKGNPYLIKAQNYISFVECATLKAKPLKKGTIVFAKIGEAIKLNRRAILGQDSLVDNNVMGLFSFSNDLNKSFLFYFFLTVKLGDISQATTVPSVRKSDIEQIQIPLPPLPEQQRIVAKIEELFTKLDAGVDTLKKAQVQLGRYRQAVLKAAVTGELTREWRESHRGALEPADDLLARILTERRAKWEAAQLAKMQVTGKSPKNDDWKQKYQEPAAPDTGELPELPGGWKWIRAEQLCDFITKGTTPSAHKLFSDVGDVPFIKVYNLTHVGKLDFTVNPTFVSHSTHMTELARSKVFPGDVLMNIVGPPLGKVSIVPDYHEEWNINQAIAVFRTMPSFDRRYLSICLLTGLIQSWAERRAKATAGQFNLTLEICRDLPLPLPSFDEQQQIVWEVERLLSIVDAMEQTIWHSLKQAEGLRQSILQQAFSGKLVPQDPANEPADNLLTRIKAERAQNENLSRKSRHPTEKNKQPVQPDMLP